MAKLRADSLDLPHTAALRVGPWRLIWRKAEEADSASNAAMSRSKVRKRPAAAARTSWLGESEGYLACVTESGV